MPGLEGGAASAVFAPRIVRNIFMRTDFQIKNPRNLNVQCSHWEPGGIIKRTPSARGEIMKADGSRELAPIDAMEALALQTREEDEHSSEEEDGGLSGAAAGSVF